MSGSTPPLSWIRRVIACVPRETEIPLFGYSPPFDVHRLSSQLASQFEAPELSIALQEQSWTSSDEVKEMLGIDPFIAAIRMSPLNNFIYFAMTQADFSKFAAWMMHKKERDAISRPLKEGFCRFLLLEALDASSQIEPLQQFTMCLSDLLLMPEGSLFCIKIELKFAGRSCWAKLILPSAFRSEWVAHFSFASEGYVPTEMTRTTELSVAIQAGSVRLSQQEFRKIELGDVLLFDVKQYNPKQQTGIVSLKVGMVPLFYAKVQEGSLNIVDYAVIQEDIMTDEMEDEYKEQPPQDQSEVSSEDFKEESGLSEEEDSAVVESVEKTSSLQDVPLDLCVEVARLQMTLDRLMQLQPGNLLELPVHPDQGVSLTINGKRVGRAELIYLGEQLGIRVLEIG